VQAIKLEFRVLMLHLDQKKNLQTRRVVSLARGFLFEDYSRV